MSAVASGPRYRDVILGDNLAETQALNSPERRAGEDSRDAVARANDLARMAANRHRFRIAVLGLIAVMALIGLAVRLLEGS